MPKRFGKTSRVSLMLSAGLVGIVSPAYAQETPSEGINDSNTIVVVAQGREQLLSDVPVAVSAVNAETLENTGANDIRQLNQVVPSLLVSSTGNEANGSARIRGIGTVGDNPGLESSVAVFIDGVYRSRSGIGLNELGEIERVEVLRGPQGTLFGRNASAGIISIYSKKPEFEFGGFGEATYGNYDNIRVAGGLTGPISQTLAARLDGVYEKRDGFLRDVTNNIDLNNRDRYFVKGQLLWEPTDDVSFRFIADYTNRDERCCGAVYLGRDFNPLIGDLNNPSTPLVPLQTNGNNIINVLRDLGQPMVSFNDPFSRNAYVTPGRNYNGSTKDGGVSLEVNWNLGGVSLTSITGYREYKNSQAGDIDYSTLDILYRSDDEDAQFRRFKTFTQELRVQGEAFGGTLDWLVGGYFANEDLTVRDNLRFGNQYGRFASCRLISGGGLAQFYSPGSAGCITPTGRAVLTGAVPGVASPFGAAGPAIVAGIDRLDAINNRGSISDRYFQNSRNFAIFTHNIVHITDRLDLTLGVRYTNERKRFNATFSNDNIGCVQNQAALTPFLTNAGLAAVAGGIIGLSCQGNSTAELNGVSINDRRTESEFTGTAVLSWKATDDLLFYGSASRGYKAGGFNLDRSALKGPIVAPLGQVPTTTFAAVGGAQALVGNLQFDQEIVDAFELGMKYASGPLTVNVALFRQQFENFQLNTFNGTVFLVQTVNGCSTNLGGADRDQNLSPAGTNFNANAALTGACAPGDTTYGVRAQGVEVEASINPVRNFTVNGGVTYAQTKYRNNLVGNKTGAPLDPALRLLPGDNLSNAPELTLTGSVAWTPDIGDSGLSGLVYVDTRMTEGFNTGSDLFPQKEQPSFVVVNARVGLRGPDQGWAVELWAQNLFNEDFTQVAFNSPFQAGATSAPFVDPQFPGGRQIFSAFLGEPRTYGITLRSRF